MSIAELRLLPPGEKLKIIEILWGDLMDSSQEIQSPEWHEVCLREREAAYGTGTEQAMGWEDAKNKLRPHLGGKSGSCLRR